ncbi:MAG: hypothetical protein ABJF10_13850 [Chthoniobacter sp.]|uniref:hypothetical protein n=1 Tax=Chthoniobacter sp. TaxID=2510640 RepID=UPI0032A3DABF
MKTHRLASLLLCSLAPLATACGPWLPSLLLTDDKQQALHPPMTTFRAELRHLPALPRLPAGLKARSIDEEEYRLIRAGEPEINKNEDQDVLAALAFHGVPLARQKEVAEGYWKVRRAMQEIRDPLLIHKEVNPDAADVLRGMPLPAELPPELADYLQGAIAFHCGQIAEARAAWEKLLARPAAERHFRSTWAAYMLGRMAAWNAADDKASGAEAKRWLQRVRTLAQEGGADSLNLVGMSYYWEGLIEEDRAKAAALFCLSFRAGCPWSLEALQDMGPQLLNTGTDLDRAHDAAVPLLRQLVTASAVTRYSPYPYAWESADEHAQHALALSGWLKALEQADLKVVEDADRLAWVTYDAGDFAGAARWLKKAPAGAPIAQWLRGKLALRAGHDAEAARYFTAAAHQFTKEKPEVYPGFQWWSGGDTATCQVIQGRQLQGDLGITEMARARFPQALDAFLRSGCWLDAAYVAEQVMTPKELLAFYRQHPDLKSRPKIPPPKEDEYPTPVAPPRENAPLAFRYMLARRLAREGRLAEARASMPEPLRARFDEYRADYQRGHDRRLPAEERAAALWQAARIHRYLGMELFGAETAPDWSFFDGNYELDDIGGLRAGLRPPSEWRAELFKKTAWLPRITSEEIARNLRLRPTPNVRFHYRYVAAELAWQAARLRAPDDETARMLCIAGGWLQNRDPQSADRFYQELVGRCGQTALGREGERRRWFPTVNDEPFQNPLLRPQ